MLPKHASHKLVLSFTAAILAAGSASALEVPLSFFGTNMPPLEFHGFGSQGFLYSGKYNYLDDNTKSGSFRFTEAGLNASINPFPRTRISAQAFTFDVGDAGGYDIVLDYAQAEYTFNDYIGVRAGRIRRPEGIYNDIQDVDLARTSVLLPQGMYNARWRDFYVSMDGSDIFGTIPLSKAGTLSYDLYYGFAHPQLNGGLALQKANQPPYSPLAFVNSPAVGGGQLWWNTPLSGLRAGAGLSYFENLTFQTQNGVLAEGSPFVQHYSLEYVWKGWTFQAEYYTYAIDYAISKGGVHITNKHIEPDSWYGGAAYRFNRWVEVGGYYSEYYPDVHNRSGTGLAAPSDAYQKDFAVTLRLDPKPWWVVKIEGHYIHGTGQLYDNVANPVRNGDGWFMLAVKTTFSF